MGDYREKNGRTDLLDEIAARMNYLYLSDLRKTKHQSLCCQVVTQIAEEEYTAVAWNDTYSYITGRTAEFATSKEAKEQLILWLKGEK